MNDAQKDRLVDYVIDQLQRNVPEEAIEQSLIKAGYDLPTIDKIYDVVESRLQTSVAPTPEAVRTDDGYSPHFFDTIWIWAKSINLFKGRLGRRGYVMAFFYFYLICFGLVAVLFYSTFSNSSSTANFEEVTQSAAYGAYIYIIAIPGNLIFFSIYVRRFHDIGGSGWYSLLLLIPVLGFFITAYLLFKKSEQGINKYGVAEHSSNIFALLGLHPYHEAPIVTASKGSYK